jgi:uncharacterized protein YbdZ (MbtH family)
MADPDSPVLYRVVQIADEQFTVLPIDDPLPAGAIDVGQIGTHDACLQFLRRENAGRRGRPREG